MVEEQKPRRTSKLLPVLVGFTLTLLTVFLPPMFPTPSASPNVVERGYPCAWLTYTKVPGTSLPIIGPLLQTLEASTLHFSWQMFLLDMAVITVAVVVFMYGLIRRGQW